MAAEASTTLEFIESYLKNLSSVSNDNGEFTAGFVKAYFDWSVGTSTTTKNTFPLILKSYFSSRNCLIKKGTGLGLVKFLT